MAQPIASTPKIEELKGRLRAEPKSRMFYPLAEELRKIGRLEEAEKVLRDGLNVHASYLSAWISLGRVLKDIGKSSESAEVLNRALVLDPGNVVVARLAAEAYVAMGEKVEAVKKYKLVNALMPGDEAIEGEIERLTQELNAPALVAAPAAPEVKGSSPLAAEPLPVAAPAGAQEAPALASPAFAPVEAEQSWGTQPTLITAGTSGRVPFEAVEVDGHGGMNVIETGEQARDSGVNLTDHDPTGDHIAAQQAASSASEAPAFETSAPEDSTPSVFDSPLLFSADREAMGAGEESVASEVEPDVFGDEAEPQATAAESGDLASVVEFPSAHQDPEVPAVIPQASSDAGEEVIATATMADLYANQGHHDAAREIYTKILQKDSGNESVKGKLQALPPGLPAQGRAPAVLRLEQWLGKVSKRER